MYRLEYSPQSNIFGGDEPLKVGSIFQKVAQPWLLLRQGGYLKGYRNSGEDWNEIWQEKVFTREDSFSSERYPWIVLEKLLEDGVVVVVKHPDGVKFFQSKNDGEGLEFMKTDGLFHDVYSNRITFGKFYPDAENLGLLARNPRGNASFYTATAKSLATSAPILELDVDLSLGPEWSGEDARFGVLRLRSKEQELITLRTRRSLEFFAFDEEYRLKKVLESPELGLNRDELLFADLTHSKFKDALRFNSSGLFLYSYDERKQNYDFRSRNEDFSFTSGWKESYSKSFADIDGDSYEELIFTGNDGLEILSYDSKADVWDKILTPETQPEEQRYSSFVGSVKLNDEISVFTQKASGEVNFARVKKSEVPSTTPREEKTTTEVSPTELPVKFCSSEGMRVSPLKLGEVKTKLRWLEQHSEDFLKDSLSNLGGEVNIGVPLVDTEVTEGWGLKLDLSYRKKPKGSLLGEKWFIPLAQDYVTIDRKSIFPEDWVYYLVIQGQVLRLEQIQTGNGTLQFKLAGKSYRKYDMSIAYDNSKWTVRDAEETAIYGGSDDSQQLSLSWKNWPTSGRDANSLQPEINSWYLSSRENNLTGQKLVYTYYREQTDFSGKTYTSAIRLSSVKDGNELNLSFEYSPKETFEYSVPNPIGSEGDVLFPVPLTESHFVSGYSLQTSSYTQTLTFKYSLTENTRLLSSVEQEEEVLMKFGYEKHDGEFYLSSFGLPQLGPEVRFGYEIQKSPEYTVKYPVSDTPKFASGFNYTVMAYQKNEEIAVQLMSSDFTQILKSCLADLDFECPKTSGKDMKIVPYEDSFVIYLKNGDKQLLYCYSRRDGKWSKNAETLSFPEKAKLYFGSKVFASLDDGVLTMFGYGNGWEKNSWTLGGLAEVWVSRNFAAVYATDVLKLFYFDAGKWKERIVADLTGKGPSGFAEKFDVVDEVKKNVTEALNQYVFQASNNVLLHNSISEDQGVLSSELRLYTLGPELETVHEQVVHVKRENVYELHRDVSNKDNTLTTRVGYDKIDGLFRLRAKDAWGRKFDEIESGRRDEAKRKFLEDLNKDKDFTENARKGFTVTLSQYLNRLSGRKVYCSNDTLVTFSGSQWETGNMKKENSVHLGKQFKLERSEDEKSWTLYRGNERVKDFSLYSKDAFLNSYPSFIASQPTENSVEVVGFADQDNLGISASFPNEKLVFNNGQNLMTLVNVTNAEEPMELLVRPAANFAPKDLYVVSRNELTDGKTSRKTAFKTRLEIKQKPFTVTQIMTEIPGGSAEKFGYHELTYTSVNGNKTKAEKWYDFRGLEVNRPKKQKTPDENQNSKDTNPSHLLDKTGRWLICDFTPHTLEEEMGAYLGFEDYETAEIAPGKNWEIRNANVVRGLYTFSGQNYLLLDSANNSYVEAILKPRDQNISYLASSWIRTDTEMVINSPGQQLKATLIVKDAEIMSFNSEVKDIKDGWSYLELLLDFPALKSLYKDYLTRRKHERLPENPKFGIKLKAEAPVNQKVQLDNLRFIPLDRTYETNVFHGLTGKKTSVLLSNGQAKRYLYNRLMENVATLDESGRVSEFLSKSLTGKFPNLEITKPSVVSFRPQEGFVENFDPRTLCERWEIAKAEAWEFSPWHLRHLTREKDRFSARTGVLDESVTALRFYFALGEEEASLSLFWKDGVSLELSRQKDESRLSFRRGKTIAKLPTSGELIVAIDEKHVWLWIDGVLLLDVTLDVESDRLWSEFSLEAKGKLFLEDLLVMSHPGINVQYFNSFGEKVQEIRLESSSSALIKEILYDELGRGAITTKSTKIVASDDLLAFRSNFTANKFPADENSVWETGKLRGEIDLLNPEDDGYSYTRTTFDRNPLNEKSGVGMPGREFSVTGDFSIKFSRETDLSLMNNLFPKSHGYRHEVQKLPNRSVKVLVFDSKAKQVANYVRVPGHDHSLSTYEYDLKGNLIKILPPAYHERVNTVSKTEPWKTGTDHLSPEESRLQASLGTHTTFDESGNLLKKSSPDSKPTEYVYDPENRLRFMIFPSDSTTNHTVYMDYDSRGQLWRSGHFETQNSNGPPKARDYQTFYYSYDEQDPTLRGKVKQCITQIGAETVVDKLYYGSNDKLTSKETLASFHKHRELSELKKVVKHDRTHSISYPLDLNGEKLSVLYTYNKLGQLVGLGSSGNPYAFAKFVYHPTGQPTEIRYLPGEPEGFVRKYSYNSPGFLVGVSDPFMTADVSYTRGGYGQSGFGDGSIMNLAHNATWTYSADDRWFRISESDLKIEFPEICLKALKRLRYLSKSGEPLRAFVPDLETQMPLVCGGESSTRIAKLLAQKSKPTHYGHTYAYGNHQELTKAKYFTQELKERVKPLQKHTFREEILSVSLEQSEHIWKKLKEAGFILVEQKSYDPETAVGKRGESFIRDEQLRKDLTSTSEDFLVYLEPISKLLTSALAERKTIKQSDFEQAFLNWEGIDETTPRMVYYKKLETAKTLGSMLAEKRYSTSPEAFLKEEFLRALDKYEEIIPEIVGVLRKSFAHALGQCPFDLESHDIDANGNHRLFYSGNQRYELSYHEETNKIHKVRVSGKELEYEMKHDHLGNVVQALHRGIRKIEYHPVSQRVAKIFMMNGLTVEFYYDVRGERVLKRVLSRKGQLKRETHYIRDEKGRVLLDKFIEYGKNAREVTTGYLYGPKGLLGFVRNGKFFSVTTDHGRSVRLVIRRGKVVAAYDYLPYGQLMRYYGSDPDADVRYRYTGQEFDEETGLYNYHARVYDPRIGRFYQPDPKSQYFSPYKYAGNSPISSDDPDGEFFWFFIPLIIGAVVGGYLGAAAVNHTFNPLDWNWKSPDTWLGMFEGAIAGATIPFSFGGGLGLLAGEFAISFGQTYISLAMSNGSWNPAKWDWTSPATYLALFESLDLGKGAEALRDMRKLAKTVRTIVKIKDLESVFKSGLKLAFTVGAIYGEEIIANDGELAFWKFDWTNPDTIQAAITGLRYGAHKNFKGLAHDLFDFYHPLDYLKEPLENLGIQPSIMGLLQSDDDPPTIESYEKLLDDVIDGSDLLKKITRKTRRRKRRALLNLLFASPTTTEKEHLNNATLTTQTFEDPKGTTSEDFATSGSRGSQIRFAQVIKTTLSLLPLATKLGNLNALTNPKPETSSDVLPENMEKNPTVLGRPNLSEIGLGDLEPETSDDALPEHLGLNPTVLGLPSLKTASNASPETAPEALPENSEKNPTVPELESSTPGSIPDPETTPDALPENSEKSPKFLELPNPEMTSDVLTENLEKDPTVTLPNLNAIGLGDPKPETSYDALPENSENNPTFLELASSNTGSNPNPETTHNPLPENSTILQLGDHFAQNSDSHGLLTWAVLLARKLTGYKEKPTKKPGKSAEFATEIQLSLRSNSILEKFTQKLERNLESLGLESSIVETLINPKDYSKAVREVSKKLSQGEIREIPKCLNKLLLDNLPKIGSQLSKKQTDQLLAETRQFLYDFSEKLVENDKFWFSFESGVSKKCTGSKDLLDLMEQSGFSKVSRPMTNGHGNLLTEERALIMN